MSKKLLGLLTMVFSVVAACTSDHSDLPSHQSSEFKVTSNPAQLNAAVNLNGAGVIAVNSITKQQGKASVAEDTPQVSNIALEQIATVDPPVLDGQAMRATHVAVNGNYAYVAYTKEGSTYLGGIDIIDISDKFHPVITSRMTTGVSDINALFYKDGTLYFTGATSLPEATDRAIIGMVSASAGEFTSAFSTHSVTGQAGVDIFPLENKVVALSGSDGIIGAYSASDLSMADMGEKPYSDLRSGAYSNGKLVVLSGTSGLLQLKTDFFDTEKSISTPNLVAESKRTISFLGNLIMVSEGANGVGIYDLETGTQVASLPINMLPDTQVIPSEKVTNAVATSNGFILMANGGAGFGITKLNDSHQISEEGLAEIDGSANYVQAKGDYIFIASGTGGLRILKMSQANDDEIASATSADFIDCDAYGPYEDNNSNLSVPTSTEVGYSGVTTLKHLNVSGTFNYCGTLNIEKSTNIDGFGTFNMRGALAVGQVGKNENFTLTSGSVTRIEGSLIVYGDLIINSDATLEFMGENSTVYVYGEVRKEDGSSVSGNFTDESNKL